MTDAVRFVRVGYGGTLLQRSAVLVLELVSLGALALAVLLFGFALSLACRLGLLRNCQR